jgi:hypothetical protein
VTVVTLWSGGTPVDLRTWAYHPGPSKFLPSSSTTYVLPSIPQVHQCMSEPEPGYFDGRLSQTSRSMTVLRG